MSVRELIRVIGKYKGMDKNGIVIGGVLFKQGRVTECFIPCDQYLKLLDGCSSGWFEIFSPITKEDVKKMISESISEGVPGPKGEPGEKGADGKSVELRMSGTNLEWRQTGGSWETRIDIATLISL